MREMVLNHASLQAPHRYTAVEWLKGMVAGMVVLAKEDVVQKTLWMSRSEYETRFMPEWSLWDAFHELQRGGARYEHERRFIIELLDKRSRPLSEIDRDIGRCEVVGAGGEAIMLSLKDSVPLRFCADSNAIAVGYPFDMWDCDQITVNGETPKTIDNLTRSAHARSISERHRATLPQPKNFAELWETRRDRFPCLEFGLDVKRHLAKLDTAVLQTVIKRLESLDKSAREWRVTGGAISWQCEVTNESETVRKSKKKWRPKRTFRSHHGTREDFLLHTKFGDYRIHLRIESSKYEVEIGYIGEHLPIPTA